MCHFGRYPSPLRILPGKGCGAVSCIQLYFSNPIGSLWSQERLGLILGLEAFQGYGIGTYWRRVYWWLEWKHLPLPGVVNVEFHWVIRLGSGFILRI